MATMTFIAGTESVSIPGYYEWSEPTNWSGGVAPTQFDNVIFGASSPNLLVDAGVCWNLDGSAYTNTVRAYNDGGRTLYVYGDSYVWGPDAKSNTSYKYALDFHSDYYSPLGYTEPTTVTVTNGAIRPFSIRFDQTATYNVTDDVITDGGLGGTFETHATCVVNMAGQYLTGQFLNIRWGSQVVFAEVINRTNLRVTLDDWIYPNAWADPFIDHGPGASVYFQDGSSVLVVAFGNVSYGCDVVNTVSGNGVLTIGGSLVNYAGGTFTNPETVLSGGVIHYVTLQKDLTFENDLTFEEGAQVRMYVDTGYSSTIDVLGEFNAPGTASNTILFYTSTASTSAYFNIGSCGDVSYVIATDIDSSGGAVGVGDENGTLLRTVNWYIPGAGLSSSSSLSSESSSRSSSTGGGGSSSASSESSSVVTRKGYAFMIK